MTGHVPTSLTGHTQSFRPGTWWIDETGRFHSAFGVDESFDHFFFRHLGHLKLVVNPPGVSIIWDVHSVSGDAMALVIDRLSDSRDTVDVHLRFFYYGWVDERFQNQDDALKRIHEITRFQSVELIRSTYIDEHDVSAIGDATDLISNGFRLWESASGNLKHADQEKLSAYMPHVLIFRPGENEQNLIFSHVGSRSTAAQVYGEKWAASAVNEVSDSSLEPSNMNYDQRVSAAYGPTLETEEPRYDHVRALLHLESQSEPFWVSYERLLIHSLLHDGSPAVICLVNRTQNVSIPLAGGSLGQ